MTKMLTRWEPFREMATLRNTMDRFFDESLFDTIQRQPVQPNVLVPAFDVSEDENAYIVTASVPGVDPKDIEVTLTGNVLTIKGESSEDKEAEGTNYHLCERRFGRFSRSLTLPITVESDKVEATHNNGVLSLRLPKTEGVKPKKIDIKAETNDKG